MTQLPKKLIKYLDARRADGPGPNDGEIQRARDAMRALRDAHGVAPVVFIERAGTWPIWAELWAKVVLLATPRAGVEAHHGHLQGRGSMGTFVGPHFRALGLVPVVAPAGTPAHATLAVAKDAAPFVEIRGHDIEDESLPRGPSVVVAMHTDVTDATRVVNPDHPSLSISFGDHWLRKAAHSMVKLGYPIPPGLDNAGQRTWAGDSLARDIVRLLSD